MKRLFFLLIAILGFASIVYGTRTTLTQTFPNCPNTVSTQLVAANISRNFLLIVNDSSNIVYLAFGTAAVVNQGIRLNPGGSSLLLDDKIPTAALNCIANAGATNAIMVSEGVGP